MKKYTWEAIAIFCSLALSPISAQELGDVSPASVSTYSFFSGKVEADTQPIEIGVKFRTRVNGEVSAIRFYRDVPIDSGYVAHLWSATGELLGSGLAVEGQGPTPGWQTIQLYPPVPIVAGQTYIASYYASQGQYTVSENFFTQNTIRSGPLYILSNREEGGNGVYIYGAGGGFPTETYKASNYWVDVIFTPTSFKGR
jgi:hypothetical protein